MSTLFIIGGIAVVVGLVLWLAMGLVIAGLCVLGAGVVAAGIGGIIFLDYNSFPPAIVGAYENGVCIANVNGVIFEAPYAKMCSVKFQEFYAHRFANMELSGQIMPPGEKKVLVNNKSKGQPTDLILLLESKGVMKIETWQEVLARTGG